ncbi:Eaa1 [Serratia sp. M24T3]|nr:Eaa1 [Serratia sp. M24T3]
MTIQIFKGVKNQELVLKSDYDAVAEMAGAAEILAELLKASKADCGSLQRRYDDLAAMFDTVNAASKAKDVRIAELEEVEEQLISMEGIASLAVQKYNELKAEIAEMRGAAVAVAYMHHSGQVVTRAECCDDKTFAICCKVETPLFTHPAPPVVVLPIRAEHAEWSQATFGNVGPVGPLKHLSKEAIEAAEAPEDLSEWADMQFLLWDAQRRAGITDSQIEQAMIEKLAINKARSWPEPKDGEPRLHVKQPKWPRI